MRLALTLRYSTTMAAVLAAIVSTPAFAQSGRLSLAERVARLEQQTAGQDNVQAKIELLNRISELQNEVQALRSTLEQQKFEIESLKQRSRDQYVDLDSRITRLEGGATGSASPAGGNPPPEAGSAVSSDTGIVPAIAATPTPAAPAPPGQLTTEEPQVQAPPEAPSDTMPLPGNPPATTEPAAVPPAGEAQAYEAAFNALKEGQYAEAARRFQAFLEQFPNGDYAPNAQYWLGESYYVTQNYQIALDTFQALLTRFPNSAKAPDALLKIGYCHYELRQWSQAEAVLNQVIQQYPDTSVARLAQGRLRALRLENRQ